MTSPNMAYAARSKAHQQPPIEREAGIGIPNIRKAFPSKCFEIAERIPRNLQLIDDARLKT
jgi:hypothetical protein